MRDFFYTLADEIQALLGPGELFLAYLQVEDSSFVRFNRNRVRQAGQVRQIELSLELIQGQHHAGTSCTLNGVLELDLPIVQDVLESLRTQCKLISADPYLLYATDVRSTEAINENTLPEAASVVREIVTAAEGLDLVGFWASGMIYLGFANALGQRNFYSHANFNLDWSCYKHTDKAVKASYAGFNWDTDILHQKMATLRKQLDLLGKGPKTIDPGQYRVYLAPSALKEIFGLLAWDSFGLKSHRTRQTALIKMIQARWKLHPEITLTENSRQGITPRFTDMGFIKPEEVKLVERGRYRECLVSPRSSKEYDVPVNSGGESPQSLDLAAGSLPSDEIPRRLDRGIYINNLWYCNFSDRNAARVTGMTRYACLWVDDGKLVGPINVMRFDESIYTMLGDKLLGFTQEREFILEPDTYFRRSVSSMRLPGALIEDFRFTL